MTLNFVWKFTLSAAVLGGALAFLGTGCSSSGTARISNAKGASSEKSGFIDAAAGEVKVHYTIEGEDAVIGGDVRFPVSKIRESSAVSEGGLGLFRAGNLWPNGRVPYVVSADFCCSAELKEAIQLWAAAGVKIVPKTASDKDYLYIVNEPPNTGACGASHGLGRMGGAQKLTGSRDPQGCGSTLATMVHELGHALGFLHEHTRPDRDSYLVFPPAAAADSQNKIDGMGQMLGKFDVNSVMMYSSKQIPGMLNRATGGVVPEIVRPSAADIQRTASVYGLTATGTGSQPPPATAGGSTQPPAVGQPATGFSYVAPFNACNSAVGVNDSFPQLGISQDNIPYFSCRDPQFTLGRPIIVCRSSIDASSCFYTKRILVNGQIKHEADVLNQGGSSAGSSPAPQPASNVRSYVAPMNGCRDVFGVQDSFPRLTFDSANQPVFVCKFGTYAPYPVMACYLNGASQSCFDTGLIANF